MISQVVSWYGQIIRNDTLILITWHVRSLFFIRTHRLINWEGTTCLTLSLNWWTRFRIAFPFLFFSLGPQVLSYFWRNLLHYSTDAVFPSTTSVQLQARPSALAVLGQSIVFGRVINFRSDDTCQAYANCQLTRLLVHHPFYSDVPRGVWWMYTDIICTQ